MSKPLFRLQRYGERWLENMAAGKVLSVLLIVQGIVAREHFTDFQGEGMSLNVEVLFVFYFEIRLSLDLHGIAYTRCTKIKFLYKMITNRNRLKYVFCYTKSNLSKIQVNPGNSGDALPENCIKSN